MKLVLPNGPRNRKKDLGVDWHKGDWPVWINSSGNPVGKADLSLFSEIVGCKITAGDMRKHYCDALYYNPNQVSLVIFYFNKDNYIKV